MIWLFGTRCEDAGLGEYCDQPEEEIVGLEIVEEMTEEVWHCGDGCGLIFFNILYFGYYNIVIIKIQSNNYYYISFIPDIFS